MCEDNKKFSVYSNGISLGFSLYDFVIKFSQNSPFEEEAKDLGEITFSPQHAKVFSNLLQVNIKQYEATHGEIILPEDKEDSERVMDSEEIQ